LKSFPCPEFLHPLIRFALKARAFLGRVVRNCAVTDTKIVLMDLFFARTYTGDALKIVSFLRDPYVVGKMIRKELARIVEERKSFRGTFVRYGFKSGWRGRRQETVLLRDIYETETGTKITDHLWFNLTKQFESLQLSEGDRIEFDARAKAYVKGYVNNRGAIDQRKIDYKLSHPTSIRKAK